LKKIIIILFLINIPIFAIEKNKHTITVEYKTYNISATEKIALFGAKERKFINENFYWGEAGYGAITGKRSGYLEGGVITGFQKKLSDILLLDCRLFVGAGGGGSAPQGGGFIVNPTIGLGLKLSKQYSIFLEFGYINFLNGDIESNTLGINFNLNTWSLNEAETKKQLSHKELEKLEKHRVIEHILYETYLKTDRGITSVFGYHFDSFFTKNLFFATTIFGAVGGKCGGYGIAAFGGGYRQKIINSLEFEAKIITGSGGGGGLAAGGGFAIEGMTGLSYEFTKNIFLDIRVGYLTFPTGSFSTTIINIGISHQKYAITLPFSS
jgi:hypothetical protein